MLADPDRVVVELPETSSSSTPRSVALNPRRASRGAALVSTFRFGQFARGRSQIVFDLSEPARIVKAVAEPTEVGRGGPSGGGTRDHGAGHIPRRSPARRGPRTFEGARARGAGGRAGAGHAPGGHRRRAWRRRHEEQSAPSAYEKDIVLDVARRLAAKLEAGGRARTMC
ncbi:MAG: hypothetical protein U1E30_04560 [Rhodoblastus sp.]